MGTDTTRWTPEQKLRFVEEYEAFPDDYSGRKSRWLKEQGIATSTLYQWQKIQRAKLEALVRNGKPLERAHPAPREAPRRTRKESRPPGEYDLFLDVIDKDIDVCERNLERLREIRKRVVEIE